MKSRQSEHVFISRNMLKRLIQLFNDTMKRQNPAPNRPGCPKRRKTSLSFKERVENLLYTVMFAEGGRSFMPDTILSSGGAGDPIMLLDSALNAVIVLSFNRLLMENDLRRLRQFKLFGFIDALHSTEIPDTGTPLYGYVHSRVRGERISRRDVRERIGGAVVLTELFKDALNNLILRHSAFPSCVFGKFSEEQFSRFVESLVFEPSRRELVVTDHTVLARLVLRNTRERMVCCIEPLSRKFYEYIM